LPFTSGPVSLFERVSFGHVLALLGRAVKTRFFPVVHMRFCVNPHQIVAATGRRRVGRCLGAVLFAGARVAAPGLAAAELLGLNRSPSENLAGDGEGLVAACAFLRVPFALGAPAGDAAGGGDAVGLAVVPASAFFCDRPWLLVKSRAMQQAKPMQRPLLVTPSFELLVRALFCWRGRPPPAIRPAWAP
jgi:hypothetical protein